MGTSAPAPPTQPAQTYYSGTLSYTPALFPAPMLPSLSTMGTPSMPAAPKESLRERREEGRDELVEVGTILALLKLVLG